MKDFLKKYNLFYKKDLVLRFIFLGMAFWGVVSLVMVAISKWILPQTTMREQQFLLNLHTISNDFLNNLSQISSEVFQPEILTIVLVIIGLILIFAKKWGKIGTFIIMSAGGAAVFGQIFKRVLMRPRPALWEQLSPEESYSFPSGHALMVTVLVGIILVLAFKFVKNKIAKWALAILAIFVVILISWARLYLGVHYPTDVIFGIDIGILWVWAASSLFLVGDLISKKEIKDLNIGE